ncbi:MAG: ABC transporter ATP-binding protein [Janthinobacterium lividum]
MQVTLEKLLKHKPHGRKNRRRDSVAEIRMRAADDAVRNPAKERQAMIRFLSYLTPYLPLFITATICGIVNYTVGAVVPSVTGFVIDRIIMSNGVQHAGRVNRLYPVLDNLLHRFAPGAGPVGQANFLLGLVIAILLLMGIVMFMRGYLVGIGGQRVIFKLRNDLYEHIQGLSLSFFQQNRSGSIVSRLTSDIALAQNFIGNACTLLWMDSISVIGIAIWLFMLSPRMAAVSLVVLPFWVFSVRFFGQRIRKASHAVQEGLSELSGQVQEKVAGATVVQAFAREKRETRLFHRMHRSLYDRQITTVRYQALNMAASNVLTSVAPITVVLFGAHEVLAGRMTTGMMITFWTTLGMFYMPLQRLTDMAAVIANAGAAIDRIFDIFDIAPDIADAEGALALPAKIEGHVELRNVSFGYDPDVPILKGLNLDIKPGEVIAFVGPSGAGKSTLVNLVPRFYDVTGGQILVDGQNIADVKVKSLRNNIGMVLQDNILFTGTIKENILYGRPGASDAEIVEAAVAANAHHFIENLPDGYETEIGERGTKLSGGQKQRLAITRAFLRDPRILILDEATSALDSESEKLIQNALNRLMIGRTTLIIAHRLSTIMHADKIVAMQDGRIIEVGSHTDLLANRSLYYHLYKAQFEHALSMPMPEEWAQGEGMTTDASQDRLARAIQ